MASGDDRSIEINYPSGALLPQTGIDTEAAAIHPTQRALLAAGFSHQLPKHLKSVNDILADLRPAISKVNLTMIPGVEEPQFSSSLTREGGYYLSLESAIGSQRTRLTISTSDPIPLWLFLIEDFQSFTKEVFPNSKAFITGEPNDTLLNPPPPFITDLYTTNDDILREPTDLKRLVVSYPNMTPHPNLARSYSDFHISLKNRPESLFTVGFPNIRDRRIAMSIKRLCFEDHSSEVERVLEAIGRLLPRPEGYPNIQALGLD